MSSLSSLQSITDAWGNWFASSVGTSMHWTCSTNYGEHGELGPYTQHQVAAKVTNFSYDGNSLPDSTSATAYSLIFNNDTDAAQSNTFEKTSTTTQSFSWQNTVTVDVGVTVSVTEGVPDVASGSESVSVNLSVSSSTTETQEHAQSWSVSCPVNVPPHCSVSCDMVINSQTYDINYHEQVSLTGYVNVWFNDPVTIPGGNGVHRCWFIPISEVFCQIANNLPNIDTTGYSIGSGFVTVAVQGTFSGSQGVSVGVNTKQSPLPSLSSSAHDSSGIQKNILFNKIIPLTIGAIAGSDT